MILNFRKRLRTYYTTIWRHLVRVYTRTPRLIARFAYAGASIAVAKHSKLMDRRGIRKRPRVDSGGSGSSDGAAPAPPSATTRRRASSDDGQGNIEYDNTLYEGHAGLTSDKLANLKMSDISAAEEWEACAS